MKFSKYQEDIFQFTEKDDRNLVVASKAGSGKTTSIVEMMKRAMGSSLGLAFNKSIANELGQEVNGSAMVSTVHSLGLRTLKRYFGGVNVDGSARKLINIVSDLVSDLDLELNFFELIRFIRVGRMNRVDFKDSDSVKELIDRYGMDPELLDDFSAIADLAIEKSYEMFDRAGLIDFDDMVALPVELGLHPEKFDNVFVDEIQDLNLIRLELSMAACDGRYFGVGDERQAIMGFAGCLSDAVKKVIKRTDAAVLPLSICYRCSKNIVLEAQKIVPEIEYSPWADEGVVRSTKKEGFRSELRPGDAVLCRTNAPLVSLCFKLISEGVKVTIRGRSIGKSLISLVDKIRKRSNTHNIPDFICVLDAYLTAEQRRLSRRGMSKTAVNSLFDKIECLKIIASTCDRIGEIAQKLEAIFSDDSISPITLSTVHSGKGLEWDRVFILKPELLPAPWAKKDWEKQQELNLTYVARTRARNELVYVV